MLADKQRHINVLISVLCTPIGAKQNDHTDEKER